MIELDRVDALEALGQGSEAQAGVARPLTMGRQRGLGVDRGVAYQRRGVFFAWRELLEEAEDAFRRAMAAWADVPGYDEQVGDAFMSMQYAYQINARTTFPTMNYGLWRGACGAAPNPAAQADRLITEAMSDCLRDQLPNARRATGRRTQSSAGPAASLACRERRSAGRT